MSVRATHAAVAGRIPSRFGRLFALTLPWQALSDLGSISIGQAAAVVAVCSAAYGATFGLWRSGLLAVYVAIKLPFLLLATTGLVMVLNWMIAQLLGSGLEVRQVARLTYRAMAGTALVLLSLAPITAFLALAAPPPTPGNDLPHNLLLLVHVAFVAYAGLYGNRLLSDGLRRSCRPGARVRWLHAAWLLSNAVVGGQLAWILRPFLGSPNYPVAFLRPTALEGNFYEFVFVTILWRRLLGGG